MPHFDRLSVTCTEEFRMAVVALRLAHHDNCHPEPVEGWTLRSRAGFLIMEKPYMSFYWYKERNFNYL